MHQIDRAAMTQPLSRISKRWIAVAWMGSALSIAALARAQVPPQAPPPSTAPPPQLSPYAIPPPPPPAAYPGPTVVVVEPVRQKPAVSFEVAPLGGIQFLGSVGTLAGD